MVTGDGLSHAKKATQLEDRMTQEIDMDTFTEEMVKIGITTKQIRVGVSIRYGSDTEKPPYTVYSYPVFYIARKRSTAEVSGELGFSNAVAGIERACKIKLQADELVLLRSAFDAAAAVGLRRKWKAARKDIKDQFKWCGYAIEDDVITASIKARKENAQNFDYLRRAINAKFGHLKRQIRKDFNLDLDHASEAAA